MLHISDLQIGMIVSSSTIVEPEPYIIVVITETWVHVLSKNNHMFICFPEELERGSVGLHDALVLWQLHTRMPSNV